MQGILGGKQFHVIVLNDKVTIKVNLICSFSFFLILWQVLKKKIVEASLKQDIPTQLDAEVMQIDYNDEILSNDRTLAHYGIKDNDYVYISMHR